MKQTSENTRLKYELCEAARQCLAGSSVEKLTVGQITTRAGVSRQTFYRTFQDKYDLINWYFDKLMSKSFDRMGEGKTIDEGLRLKFSYLKEEGDFFRAAFASDAQNNLKEHDFEMIFHFYSDWIVKKSGSSPTDEIALLLELYCRASIYMTVKWVLGGMQQSPEWLARLLVDALPEKLRDKFACLDLLEETDSTGH